MTAQDLSFLLLMANYWRTESTSQLLDERTMSLVNHYDIFERFYIQTGLLENSPEAFLIGSTRHQQKHQDCQESCGTACIKYVKKRGRRKPGGS